MAAARGICCRRSASSWARCRIQSPSFAIRRERGWRPARRGSRVPLIVRFNGFFKFTDGFGKSPSIGRNATEMIVRKTQPKRWPLRPKRRRLPYSAHTIECPGVCGIDIDGGLERHSRFGETLGQRAKDAEIVVPLSVLGVEFDRVAIRRFRPRRLTYTGIN